MGLLDKTAVLDLVGAQQEPVKLSVNIFLRFLSDCHLDEVRKMQMHLHYVGESTGERSCGFVASQ